MPRKERNTKYIEFPTPEARQHFKHQLALYKARLMPFGVKTEADAILRALAFAQKHDLPEYSTSMERIPADRRAGASDGADGQREQ